MVLYDSVSFFYSFNYVNLTMFIYLYEIKNVYVSTPVYILVDNVT